MGLRVDGKKSRVFCMIGDGESQEGQVWEAAMSAPHFKLSNLCVILDANNGQIDGPVDQVMPIEPIANKWRAFGWRVLEVDGHDLEALVLALAPHELPTLVLARTVKGKGVDFMEGQPKWHYGALDSATYARALASVRS